MTNLRAIAAGIIQAITEGRSLSTCLEPALAKLLDPRDRAFVQALCYGVCRFYTRLDVILSLLLKKPLKAKDSDLHAVLLVGLYQLMEMRIPPHAAIAETVNATEKLHKSWARGFVNAILREYSRQKEQIEQDIQSDLEAYYSHPAWWIDAIKIAWPANWQTILLANNTHPPFALRVNKQHLTPAQYLTKSSTAGQFSFIPESSSGLILTPAIAVEALPGFSTGEISVQDGAAQLAAFYLDLSPALHVLDACSAPGGKLAHCLETEPSLSIVAVEKDPQRLPSIKENLARLHLTAQLICADAGDVTSWWDGQLFDRILLDAPCSASGVIRRHPDIKLLRQPTDIATLAQEQLRLLTALWPLLKPGGLLLYATCSIFPEENELLLQQFLASLADAQEEKIAAEWGIPCSIGRQILPGMHQMDGFYYARLRKFA